jgi:hypothetical protein
MQYSEALRIGGAHQVITVNLGLRRAVAGGTAIARPRVGTAGMKHLPSAVLYFSLTFVNRRGLMSLLVLALTTAFSAPSAPAQTAPAEVIPVSAFVLDCQISGQNLTDCRVMDADPGTDARAAKALRLAADIQVPQALAASNPGRIKIKLNVNP